MTSKLVPIRNTMNQYYFHFTSKSDCVYDTKGRQFADLATAHHHAMLLIHKMVLLDDMDWRGWSVNVTDASNRSLLSVLFPQMSIYKSGTRRTAKGREP